MSSVINLFAYNMAVEFSKWITDKYVKWRGNAIGNDRSITEFAEYIGVSQPLMTQWMNGATPKSQKAIAKLIKTFGPEVYNVLGINPDDDPLTELMSVYFLLPADERESMVELFVEEAMKRIGGKRLK